MAYLTIARIAGDPDMLLAAYRRSSLTMTEVGRDHGQLVHVAAGAERGLLMINLWPSVAGSAGAAGDPRRLGVIAARGIDPGEIRRTHYEVENYVVFEERGA